MGKKPKETRTSGGRLYWTYIDLNKAGEEGCPAHIQSEAGPDAEMVIHLERSPIDNGAALFGAMITEDVAGADYAAARMAELFPSECRRVGSYLLAECRAGLEEISGNPTSGDLDGS